MGYFADTAFENIRKKVIRLRETNTTQRRLIVTTSTFPPDVTLDLAKTLEGYVVEDGRIVLTFKVAKILADKWKITNGSVHKELKDHGWLDDTDNLTGYRNASPPEKGKIGLAVLVGADKVLDSSSLADFYRCGPESVWQQMENSFDSWVRNRLDRAHVAYEGKTVEHFHAVLRDLIEQGCADLIQISRYLDYLPLEKMGAQDGRDAERVLLRSLDFFKLPNLEGFRFSRNKKLRPYLEQAIRFFRYDLYMEESRRNKALKTIDKLLEQKYSEISENTFFTQQERGDFKNCMEVIGAIRSYIEEEDAQARKKLRNADFYAIQEKVLEFKPQQTKETRTSVHKLSGGPVEVVLTALWETLRECRRLPKLSQLELEEALIWGDKFKYDTDGLLDGGQASAAETRGIAKEYLKKLVSGVDRFFQDGHLNFSLDGKRDVCIKSKLFHDDIELANARTAEPLLEFWIKLKFANDKKIKKKFAWRLPETQSHRMAEEIITWAASSVKKKNYKTNYLPVFHTRYHEELMRAKDDEEIRRVLLHAIRDVDTESTNLLTQKWLETKEPLLEYYQRLAKVYQKFLFEAYKNGLHSVFHKDNEQGESAWDQLRRAYVNAADACMGKDQQFQNNPVAPMLMRAFLIVAPRKDKHNFAWVTHKWESSGVATVLHPSVIEMMLARILFLFACFNYAAPREWREVKANKPFQRTKWQDYLDLSGIQFPIAGLIKDRNLAITTEVEGEELIHRIGTSDTDDAPLSTRLLLRYEGFDDEDIADSKMFAQTRESRLLKNILLDYLKIHPHARDGINLAVYRNTDIQPVISGMHSFLKELEKKNVLGDARLRPYSIVITVFSEAGEDVGVYRWMEQWKERWEAAESEFRFEVYKYCRFSIAHRVVPSENGDRQLFAKMIQDGLDVDIAVLYDFISAGIDGNEFQSVRSYDVRERTLKFPIVEKSFCTINDPELELTRSRVISNPQFIIASRHLEIMARIRNKNTPPGQEHVLIGFGDFTYWQPVVDELHKHSEWVVCIDASIDDTLIKKKRLQDGPKREIIGFGSGVGLHGELNYTVSTEHFRLSDILFRLKSAIADLYNGWDQETLGMVAASVLKEAQTLSGLSLVKATGVGDYIRDFMGYALAYKLLSESEDLLCIRLISLDAYRHWFMEKEDSKPKAKLEYTEKDESRPDLLWLKAKLDENGRISLDMHLIECKLAQQKDMHIEKATQQIKNGLKSLIPVFMPKSEITQDDKRPDQRYWWLQLHRLIASKARITRQKQNVVMAAMERLVEGDYVISWYGAVLTFWTDSRNEDFENPKFAIYNHSENKQLEFGLYSLDQDSVKLICSGEKKLKIPWNESPIQIGFDSMKDSEGDSESVGRETPKETKTDTTKIPTQPTEQIRTKRKEMNNKDQHVELSTAQVPERILLGKSTYGNRAVYWEFGHKELSNRHLLIFGTSGMGKTYAIQCLLCELGFKGQNSLVMDYTNGFLPNQLEEETKEIIKPKQHIVRREPLPVSPFKLQSTDIDDDDEIPETSVSAAKRIASTFNQVYETMKDQQYSVLFDAIMETIDNFGAKSTLDNLLELLESYIEDGRHDKAKVLSTISKIKPFILEKPFGNQASGLDWFDLFNDPENRCHVFQFTQMDSLTARLVIEFVLWDLNAFVRGTGNKNLPKVVVLDEVQNLDLSEYSPAAKYLTEGRKFGLSLIMATQTMRNLRGDKLNRLFQAGHKLFFRPADTELKEHAQLLAQAVGGSQDEWITKLANLTKEHCYSLGPSVNQSTGKLETKAFPIHISSLAERFSHAQE